MSLTHFQPESLARISRQAGPLSTFFLRSLRSAPTELREGPALALGAWRARRHYRCELRRLLATGHHLIADVGLTLEEVSDEMARPFWRAWLGLLPTIASPALARARIWASLFRDAWNEAVDKVGKVGAAAVLAILNQRYSDDVAKGTLSMRDPGGYFRSMARRAHEREIDLETEFRELRRQRLT